MDNLTLSALNLLTALAPGFLASALFSWGTVRTGTRSFPERVIEALLWSAAVAIVCGLLGVSSPSFKGPPWELATPPHAGPVLAYAGVVVVLPTSVALLVNRELYLRLLAKIGVSRKQSALPTWAQPFSAQRAWVTVEFRDGRRMIGWPTFYPDTPVEGWLYLTQAAWVHDDNEVDLGGDGVLLRIDEDVQRIVFQREAPDTPTEAA